MDKPSIVDRLEHRRLDEIHDCVVPSCRERAGCAFHVDAPLRLAGRDWTTGEIVDLCPGHAHELRVAVSDATVLGYGGQLDTPDWPLKAQLGLLGIVEENPLDRLREWDGSTGHGRR